MGRRRGRKRKITYDSNESKTAFGLIALFASVIALLSTIAEGVAFETVHKFFGGGVLLLSVSLFALSLKLFNFKPEKITTRTIVGLTIFTLAYLGFLSGGAGMPIDFKEQSYTGMYGGVLGYLIAERLGNMFFVDAVKPILGFVMYISVPLIFSISLPKYFKKQKKAFSWIFKNMKKVTNLVARKKKDTVLVEDDEITPTMFGDFQSGEKLDKKTKEQIKEKVKERIEAKKEGDFNGVATGQKLEKKKKKTKVKIKESSKSDSILMQDELKFPDWKLPPTNLLKTTRSKTTSEAGIRKNSKIIEQTLGSFKVKAQVVDVLVGPSVTQFALNIALGTKVSKISNLKNDLALALATSANAVRIEAPIPGTSFVGIEVPNNDREMIGFKELIEDDDANEGKLTATLGKNVPGQNVFVDIQKMPHLLIAGATGSGKSVVTNAFVMSLLMKKTPDEVRFILVDPKQVEFSDYDGIPHLLTPVITNMDKVNNALKWAIVEMERRYTQFKESKVRNIEGFNDKMGFAAIPYIVIVIDEMADMLMSNNGSEIESSIVKLAQKARATGIHLILATQRPSVDVITGLIKANIPGRIGMSVTTQVDSRVILDQIGAESLLGRGDMLYKNPGRNKLERIQGSFVSQKEVLKVVNFIKEHSGGEVEYETGITKAQADPNAPPGTAASVKFSDDELFAPAARLVINAGKGSSSLIQRKLSVGYNRAARLLDELHDYGVVGPPNGSKPRDILINDVEGFLSGEAEEETK